MWGGQFVSNFCGLCPKPRVWGDLVGGTDRKEKILKFRTPSTLERRTPCSPLGEDPFRLGVSFLLDRCVYCIMRCRK